MFIKIFVELYQTLIVTKSVAVTFLTLFNSQMKVRIERDFPHKVVLLGDSRVGKTSLLGAQLHKNRTTTQTPTIGCQCNDLTVNVDGQDVNMQVWDTAGQEIYRALVPIYLRDAHAAIIVYDITDQKSFNSLSEWIDILYGIFPQNSPIFFVANKIDLEENRHVEDSVGEAFATKNGGKFYRASALSGEGVNEIFLGVAKGLLQTAYEEKITQPQIKAAEKTGCC